MSCILKSGGLFCDSLQSLVLVFGFVKLSPSVYVVMTKLQHAVDQASQHVRHRGDGLGVPSLERSRRNLAPKALWLRSRAQAASRSAVDARLTTCRVPRAQA